MSSDKRRFEGERSSDWRRQSNFSRHHNDKHEEEEVEIRDPREMSREREYGRERNRERGREREYSREREKEYVRERRFDRQYDRERSRELYAERYRDKRDSHKEPIRKRSTHRDSIHAPTLDKGFEKQVSHPKKDSLNSDESRDERTIFVSQLPPTFSDKDLYDFFSSAGNINSAKIVTDKLTQKSKGIAYIEFADKQSAKNALQMSGIRIDDNPIHVQRSEIHKISSLQSSSSSANLPSKNDSSINQENFKSLKQDKVLVHNIYLGINEDSFKKVFQVIGPISCLAFSSDTEYSGTSSAIVQFQHEKDAISAVKELNEFILGGIPLKVALLPEKPANSFSNLEEFEEEHSSNPQTELFARLAREQSAYSHFTAYSSITRSSSSCIQLSGMYDPEQEESQFWEFEIAEDIRAECLKIGKVSHLKVQKNKSGDVFVKFFDEKAAQKAIEIFHGRWFGMRQISCRYIPENIYNDMFFP